MVFWYDFFVDGRKVNLNDVNIAADLLTAALAHVALSKETANYLAKVDGDNFRVMSSEALEELTTLLAHHLELHERELEMALKAA